jgi:hypothetical protein
MLRVRELVNRLKDLPDQDAVVLIGEGTEPDVWLVVTILNLFRVINLLAQLAQTPGGG